MTCSGVYVLRSEDADHDGIDDGPEGGMQHDGSGDDEETLTKTREHSRMMVAFYGSTRAYSPMFEHHGFDGLSDELYGLQKKGDIPGMAKLVTDEILDHYTVTSSWNDLGPKLVERYRDLAPNVRVTSYTAADGWSDPANREKWSHVARSMREAG